jgi:hypothetical protein
MRVYVCGASGKRIGKALDHLHSLFQISEVIHGASQRPSGVDLATSVWVDINRIPYQIVTTDRFASQIYFTRPDLVLLATATGNSHIGVRRWADQLAIPIVLVGLDGVLRTSGKGWGALLKPLVRREVTEVRLKVVG